MKFVSLTIIERGDLGMLMLTPTMTTIFLIDSDKPVNFDSVTEAVNYYFTTTPLDSPFFKSSSALCFRGNNFD